MTQSIDELSNLHLLKKSVIADNYYFITIPNMPNIPITNIGDNYKIIIIYYNCVFFSKSCAFYKEN